MVVDIREYSKKIAELKRLSQEYRSAFHDAQLKNEFCRARGPTLTTKEYGDSVEADRKARNAMKRWEEAYEIAAQMDCNIPADCVPKRPEVKAPVAYIKTNTASPPVQAKTSNSEIPSPYPFGKQGLTPEEIEKRKWMKIMAVVIVILFLLYCIAC